MRAQNRCPLLLIALKEPSADILSNVQFLPTEPVRFNPQTPERQGRSAPVILGTGPASCHAGVPAGRASVWLTGEPCRGGSGCPVCSCKRQPGGANHPCQPFEQACIGGDMLRVRNPVLEPAPAGWPQRCPQILASAVTPSPVSTREEVPQTLPQGSPTDN